MSRSLLLAASLALFGLGCTSTPKTDFAPLRPGVCAEEQVPCEGGHAWVEVIPEFAPRTLVYVIDTLSMPVVDGEGRVAGFNLDGMDSGPGTDSPEATCGEARADFVSSVDPNVRGVDNQLQMLVSTIEGVLDPTECPGGVTEGCLDATLQRSIDEGRQLLVIELSGIESFAIDEHVDFALYRVRLPPDPPPVLGPDGRLAPGQTFSGGRFMSRGTGTILHGRFAIASTRFPAEVDTGDFVLPLDLLEAELRFDLGEEALLRGVVGGLFVNPTEEATVCSVLRDLADMSVDGAACCEAPGACCNAVSAGLTFTATRAELRP